MSAELVLRPCVVGHGFSWRKQALARRFTGRADLRFVRQGHQVPAGCDLLLWGSAPPPVGVPAGVRLLRLEDGFLRSVGLGADLVAPLSWVLDDVGIYYDASRPSALERLLMECDFDAATLARAQQFRQRVVAAGLTKYNLPERHWQRPAAPSCVVLVAGQVESDASLAFGCCAVTSNLALLRAVRAARPDAWLVYKPHPDVVAGLRHAGGDAALAAACCDELLTEGAMHQLLEQVDEVHVLTSLTGFEALLRGKTVVCYGQPFYAGYGLTQDVQPHPRRAQRRLSLDALVAGALLYYPRYVSPASGQRCSPEQALDALLVLRAKAGGRTPWWRKWLRPFLARR